MPLQRPTDRDSTRATSPKLRRPLSLYEKPHSSNGGGSQSPTRLPIPSRSGSIDPRDESFKRRSFLPQLGASSAAISLAKPKASGSQPSAIPQTSERKGSDVSGRGRSAIETLKTSEYDDRKSEILVESRLQSTARNSSTEPINTRDATRKALSSHPTISLHNPSASHSGIQRSLSLKKREPPNLPRAVPAHARSSSTNSAQAPPRLVASSRQMHVVASRETNKPLIAQTSSLGSSTDDDSSRSVGRRQISSSHSKLNPPAGPRSNTSRLKPPAAINSSLDDVGSDGMRKRAGLPKGGQLARPAFTTLQQHFTPKKATKAPTSSFSNPAEPKSSHKSPLSADMLRLQTELLQLHLLHGESLAALEEYDQSAERQLRAKFDNVVACHRGMRSREREVQEGLNMMALQEWSSAARTLGLAENVQILSSLLQELLSLMEENGRFTRLVGQFETWLCLVEDNWQAQEPGKGVDEKRLREGLGDGWWAENAALTRRLTALASDLDMLVDPSEESSFGRLVRSCKAMHKTTLDELRLMVAIGQEVEMREKRRIEERFESIAAEIDVLPLVA